MKHETDLLAFKVVGDSMNDGTSDRIESRR